MVAPSPLLTVTIEADDEIHLHAGGQGVWAARMLGELGVPTHLCCALGGEPGQVLFGVLHEERAELDAATIDAHNGVYVHDRRNGERDELAFMPASPLSRHDLDDWYGTVYAQALDAKIVVLTGTEPANVLAADTYERLAKDCQNAETTVIADLSGDAMDAAVAGGLSILKVSETELVNDSKDLEKRLEKLLDKVPTIIATRAGDSALVATRDGWYEVTGPTVDPLDHRGAGDSFVAGLAAGLHEDAEFEDSLRLAWAAGTINSTRRGLGTGRGDAVRRTAKHVSVERRK